MPAMAFLYAGAGILGLIIGSFLNACIYRLPREIPISKGYSACPFCGTRLRWYELFPLFSYLGLGGRCGHCRERISPRYPAVELANALLYIALLHQYGLSLQTLGLFIVVSALIIVFFVDLETMIIPHETIFALLAAGLLLLFAPKPLWWEQIIGFFAISLPLFLLALVTQGRGIGGGDIKLMAALGFCLGWQLILLVFFIGICLGAIGSLIWMHRNKEANLKSEVPFGPYLVVGALVSIFWGEALWAWYLGLFM